MKAIKELPKDSDLAGVDTALRRAAKSAHALARNTGTPCYVVKDGKIVNVTKPRKCSSTRRLSTAGNQKK